MLPDFINEMVLVRLREVSNDHLEPLSFVWRGRTYKVVDIGRHWTEDIEGVVWRCCLIRTAEHITCELRMSDQDGHWVLWRSWSADHTSNA